MRVFVTGSRGFTGAYLVAELQRRGCEVIGYEGDVTDATALGRSLALAQPDRVVHLAAIAFIASDDVLGFYRVNQLGTLALLGVIEDIAPHASVLLASSANIYGTSTAGYLTEDSPPHPANHYAVSKWAMEMGANLFASRLKITIARPFNYTGVGQDDRFLIPKIVTHFKERARVIRLGNMDVQRDFGDVRSVVDAYASLCINPPAQPVVNICTGRVYSIRDILDMAGRITNHRIDAMVDPRFVRQDEVPILAGDPTLLRTILSDWRPREMEETLSWMLAE